MKRILFILALVALLFVSCGNEYDILSYQENEITAECQVNEKFDLEIKKAGGCVRICVISPENLGGTVFEISKESSFVIKDEMKIPLDNENIRGIYALSQIFSLSEEAITTATSEGVITFDTDHVLYTVTYGENNLPELITISGDVFEYSVKINAISLN